LDNIPADLLISGNEKKYEPAPDNNKLYAELFRNYQFISKKLVEITHHA